MVRITTGKTSSFYINEKVIGQMMNKIVLILAASAFSQTLRANDLQIILDPFISRNRKILEFYISNHEPFDAVCYNSSVEVSYEDDGKFIGIRKVLLTPILAKQESVDVKHEAGHKIIEILELNYNNPKIREIYHNSLEYQCKQSNLVCEEAKEWIDVNIGEYIQNKWVDFERENDNNGCHNVEIFEDSILREIDDNKIKFKNLPKYFKAREDCINKKVKESKSLNYLDNIHDECMDRCSRYGSLIGKTEGQTYCDFMENFRSHSLKDKLQSEQFSGICSLSYEVHCETSFFSIANSICKKYTTGQYKDHFERSRRQSCEYPIKTLEVN